MKANWLHRHHSSPCYFERFPEVEATEMVRKVIADAPHSFIQLAVRLQLDAKSAQNWDEPSEGESQSSG